MSTTAEANSLTFTHKGLMRGAHRLLPISVFVFPFGVAFGAAAAETGLSPDQALVMSMLVFAGVSQFAALDMWQSPLPYLSIALVAFAVNARHIILGAALSRYVNPLPAPHWFASLLLLSDANFADSYKAMKDGERDAAHVFGGGLVLWGVWAVSTAIGVFAGELMGDLQRFGVDVVMAAFFASLVLGMVPSWRHAIPVIVGCGVAIATLPVLPTGWNIIAAALAGGFAAMFDPKLVADAKQTAETRAHG
ncbi:MAG: AzlC family ABC transporter permease [Pseudomonadota bacterium]